MMRVESLQPSGRLTYWFMSVVLFACFLYLSVNFSTFLRGENDFLNFYAGATLCGSSDVYSAEAVRRIQQDLSPNEYPALQRSVRLPFYFCLLKPLALLSYPIAHLLFQAICLLAFVAFLAIYAQKTPDLLPIAALSLPVIANIKNGQDAILVTAFAGFGALLSSRRRDFLGGLVFSLCAIKIHLFLLLPVAVIMHRRWTLLKGGLVGGLVLAIISFLAAGWSWPFAFARSATDSAASPALHVMPTVYGAATSFGWSPAIAWGLELGTLALSIYAMSRARTFERCLAIGLIGGLLLSYHAYIQDASVLLLSAALLFADGIPKMTRGLLTVGLLPPLYYAMLSGPPWNGGIHVLLIALLVSLAR